MAVCVVVVAARRRLRHRVALRVDALVVPARPGLSAEALLTGKAYLAACRALLQASAAST